ncbi:hypothetical protein ETD86_17670 [Nonomuraea turkmeniaca]|uniref:Uncharacterized protein n=1 Tax=Nonomuraea turkmeniaca TaxID=103838 RepID=A0A5S4FJP9_9ACTN|nr:hypothetical protein [Nonomuraea turkmeniaca]TMR20819.1 hypothetical protein ETD86_17670 [Nonomuraea turkmeniaca]
MTEWLLKRAADHPRPFVVSAEHGTRARLLGEAEIARRRWRPAEPASEADLLVICGTPGEEFEAAIRTVWDDLPGPRARVDLPSDATPPSIGQALNRAVAHLADKDAQWRDAAARAGKPWSPDADRNSDSHTPDGGSSHHGHDSHASHGQEHDDDGHEGGHHEHHMGNPGGLPMAGRGPDRDGLSLDRLHVSIGPILSDWPRGLVVESVLQGDVIQDAAVRWLGSGESFWAEPWNKAAAGHPVTRAEAGRRQAAAYLDSLGRLLSVSGWSGAARRARALRDRLLADAPRAELAAPYRSFERQVRRSRTLRWMLRDVGSIEDGDAVSRLDGWLTRTRAAIDALEDETPLDGAPPVRHTLHPGLLVGGELATARLIIASLDPEPAVAHA